MSGEILFYYENTAVKMKMKNSILLDSRKVNMHNTISPPNQNFNT